MLVMNLYHDKNKEKLVRRYQLEDQEERAIWTRNLKQGGYTEEAGELVQRYGALTYVVTFEEVDA